LVEPTAMDKRKIERPKHYSNDVIMAPNEEDKTTLLIVDDNAELRQFISLRLSANYRIISAENGAQGFDLATSALPDLIISDVNMPKMSGLEMTEKLKNTPATAQIPIILLTAKVTKRDTVAGFASGADDYLTKPFDTSELVMRVNAQIHARKQIRHHIEFEQSRDILNVASRDHFHESLTAIIEANLNDPEFDVEQLADQLHMSRETLNRKCKKEVGSSPLVYINKIRMHHASILLQQNKLPVSEVAYSLGYESLAYFSRAFKKHCGQSPTDYAKSHA